MRMIALVFTAVAFASLSLAAPAFAQAPEIQCTQIKDVAPADDGWKLISIRRPKIDATFSKMSLQVYMPVAEARTDFGENAKIVKVVQCDPNQVGYVVKVFRDGDWDETQIPLPVTAKDVRIKSCTKTTKTCWSGTFDGNFDHGVTLTADKGSGPTANMVGTVKW